MSLQNVMTGKIFTQLSYFNRKYKYENCLFYEIIVELDNFIHLVILH